MFFRFLFLPLGVSTRGYSSAEEAFQATPLFSRPGQYADLSTSPDRGYGSAGRSISPTFSGGDFVEDDFADYIWSSVLDDLIDCSF